MLALGLYGGGVKLVDEATGEDKWAVQAHGTDQRSRVSMSPQDGKFVVSGGLYSRHWTLWDAASGLVHRVGATHDGTGACICAANYLSHAECPVVAHTGGIHALAFSPCQQKIATGGEDGAVILWDAQTGMAEHVMEGHFQGALSCTFSADGVYLASGSFDGSIHLWDATTGSLLRKIPPPRSYLVLVLSFSPVDSQRLVSGGSGGLIHLWDVVSGERRRSIEGRRFAVFSPDGRTIATASARNDGCQVHLVDAESGALRLSMVDHEQYVCSACFCGKDGSRLASGSGDGTCKVWDSSTGALLRTILVGNTLRSVSTGRNWVRDTQRAMAFATGQHPRLGAGSQVLELEVGVVRMVLDRV